MGTTYLHGPSYLYILAGQLVNVVCLMLWSNVYHVNIIWHSIILNY